MLDPIAALEAAETLSTAYHDAIQTETVVDLKMVNSSWYAAQLALGLSEDQDPGGFLDALPPEDFALALYDAFMKYCIDHNVLQITITNDRWPELARKRWLNEAKAVGFPNALPPVEIDG